MILRLCVTGYLWHDCAGDVVAAGTNHQVSATGLLALQRNDVQVGEHSVDLSLQTVQRS